MKILIILVLFAFLAGQVKAEVGLASWYGSESGQITANGERFNLHKFTAASWYYPFGTLVRVTCIKTGKCVTVRINDRGPAKRLHRIIDLSRGAAAKIGMLESGIVKVRVEVMP